MTFAYYAFDTPADLDRWVEDGYPIPPVNATLVHVDPMPVASMAAAMVQDAEMALVVEGR